MKQKLLTIKSLLVAALLGVGASAWGETISPTVKMTYVDYSNAGTSYGEVTTAYTGYNTISNGSVGFGKTSWGVNKITYVQVDASAVPDGATITAATLTASVSGSGRTHTFCIGYNSSTWSSTMTYNTADRTITTLSSTISINGTTTGSFNILPAFTGLDSKVITLIIYDTAAGGGTITSVSSSLTYTTETVYTATFTANEGAIIPTVTIYSNSELTSPVTNGSLTNGTTYYYKAVLAGYEDKTGSFTVSGANPTVSFTMTAKTQVTSITYKYYNGGTLLDTKTVEDLTGLYVGESYTTTWQKYWANGGNLYIMSESNTRGGITLQATNEITVNYTLSASGTYYFYEFDGTYTTRADAESNGSARTGGGTVTIPTDGIFIITANCYGSAANRTATVKQGETTLVASTTISIYAGGTNLVSAPTALNADDVITISTSDGGSALDYVILQKNPTVSGTITAAGWSTFASSYPLDLSTISGGTAYYASVASGSTVTLASTTATVPAGEGIMVKGTAGETFTIDVATSGTAISGNLLKGQTTTGDVAASVTGTNHYVFGFSKTDASTYGFYNLTAATEVAAGKAYLETAEALTAGARIGVVIEDEATGIGATLINNEMVSSGVFDLQGRRVTQPRKGLYILNGRMVVVK